MLLNSNCLCTHHEASVSSIHHTFNAVYGVDLYDTNFHFIFDDVAKNGLTELYKDAPEQLLTHMTNHIKKVSGALLGIEMKKVDNLFGNMQISYQMYNGRVVNFKRD